MPRFAPGTDAYDQESERKFRHRAQRAMNIGDLLSGLGMIGQQLGAMRRSREAEADAALESEYIGRVYQGGDQYQQPGPDSAAVKAMGPGGWKAPDVTGEVTAAGRKRVGIGDQFAALGRTFGIGEYQPRLRPEAQLRVLGAQQSMQGARQEREWKEREFGLKEREVGAKEREASAKETEARGIKRPEARQTFESMLRERDRLITQADKAEQWADLALSGELSTGDYTNDAMLSEFAASNPVFSKALRAAEDAGVDLASRQKALKRAAETLRGSATKKRDEAKKYDKYVEGFQEFAGPVMEQYAPGAARGQPSQDAGGDAELEQTFESQWRARNNVAGDASLTPEQAMQMFQEYQLEVEKRKDLFGEAWR